VKFCSELDSGNLICGSMKHNKSCYGMSIYKYMLLKKDPVIWC